LINYLEKWYKLYLIQKSIFENITKTTIMKKTITFFTLVLMLHGFNSFGQSQTTISFNDVNAYLMDNGYFFTNCTSQNPGYEIPKGSNKYSIYSSAFWFGGHVINSQLKIASPRYCNLGNDLWAGPLDVNSGNAIVPNPFSQTFWTVSKQEIQAHIANYQTPGYVVPNEIANWPAHGDVSQGAAFYIAPFVDVNNNGQYDPHLGDYPCIKGDMATYIIMNDAKGNHASGGGVINVEIHFMFYQYTSNTILNKTTFVDIEVINRGTQTLYDYYTCYYMDADIGGPTDDYFGCDSSLNLMYTYNSDNYDSDYNSTLGYGTNPPSIGVVCLSQDVESIGSFSNNVSYPYNDPTNPVEFYNTMKAQWQDGTFWQDSNGNITRFMYSGDPNNSGEWSENSVSNLPGDRRMIMNSRYGTLLPGDSYNISYAIVFGQGTDNLNSVTNLFQNTVFIQDFYSQQTQNCLDPTTVEVNELSENEFEISPNPSSGNFNVVFPKEYNAVKIIVKDAFGRIIFNEEKKSVDELAIHLNESKGIYFVVIITEDGESTKKIILN